MVAVASPLSPGGGGGGRRKGRKEGGEGKYLPGGREWSGGVYGVPSWFIIGTGAPAPQTHVLPFLPRPRLLHERKGCVITSLGPSSQMYRLF